MGSQFGWLRLRYSLSKIINILNKFPNISPESGGLWDSFKTIQFDSNWFSTHDSLIFNYRTTSHFAQLIYAVSLSSKLPMLSAKISHTVYFPDSLEVHS